jgi:hypothetical protein
VAETKLGLPTILDPASLYFEESITHEVFKSVYKSQTSQLFTALARQSDVPESLYRQACDPIEAAPYLHSFRTNLEQHISSLAAGYSSVRWLWYLRRLPSTVFEGTLVTTSSYDAALAETASGMYGTGVDNLRENGERVSYDTKGLVIARILRLCVAVRWLSQTHVLLRYAGKGASFRFKRDNPLPEAQPTEEQEAAIKLYDGRAAARQMGFGRVGTAVARLDGLVEGGILVVPRVEPMWAPISMPSANGSAAEFRVFANFCPEFVTFDRLTELINDPRLGGRSFIDGSVACVFALLSLAPTLLSNLKSALPTLVQRGYITVRDTILTEILSERLPSIAEELTGVLPRTPVPVEGQGFIASLEKITGSIWPLRPGPIIRRRAPYTWIDIYAATTHLDASLEFPRIEGGAANARADHFELSVQMAVDSTKWRPAERIRELRRRELRISGQAISDIDALACCANTFILISCKSVIYSSEYDAGDFKAVRSAATTVCDAVSEWNRKVGRIAANPRGDNYDFSEFSHFIPLVCTPHPVWVPIGIATDKIWHDLRAAVSVEELIDWLRRD